MHEFDSRAFRSACGRFPTGVTVITAQPPEGPPVGFTANSFCSLSLEPPLLLFSLGRKANCLAAFEAADHFAISVLAEGQRHLSERFAAPSGDKWTGTATELWETGAPILTGALAAFECRTEWIAEGGDHRLFAGRVTRLAIGEGRPLIFANGSYARLGSRLETPPDAAPPEEDASHLAGVEPHFTV